MRRQPLWILVAAAAVFGLVLPAAAQQAAQDYSNIRIVRVSFVEGEARFAAPYSEDWEALPMNLPVRQGYQVATGIGRTEIEFEDGATVRLAEDAEMEFSELALVSGRRLTRLFLARGTASFYAHLDRRESFLVETPHLAVEASRGSVFRIDTHGRETLVTVRRGDVRVRTAEGERRVTRGNALAFGPDTGFAARLLRADREDEWDRWAAHREGEREASLLAANAHLNAPFRFGLAELSTYGHWVQVGGHGWGWQPHGIGAGWQPFLHGYWRYARGLGWVWVSFEPWGWVPYHYGRWVYLPMHGWVWFQGGYWTWHPGLVRWYNKGDYWYWGPFTPYRDLNYDLPPKFEIVGGKPSGPRGILAKAAEVGGRPKDTPAPADGPPPAPPGAGPRDGRGVSGDVAGFPRDVENPGIIYDADSGMFVNNPNARPPRGVAGVVTPNTPDPNAPAAVPEAGAPDRPLPPRGFTGIVGPQTEVYIEPGLPAPRPQVPRGAEGIVAPRPEGPGPRPEPRVEPRPEPRPAGPRGEVGPRPSAPRPTPSVEPRPSAPPPRSEPRPSPPPPRAEPSVQPRPSPPPSPPPRAEPAPVPKPDPNASALRSERRTPSASVGVRGTANRLTTPSPSVTPRAGSTSPSRPAASRPAPQRGVSGAAARTQSRPKPN